MPAHDWTRVDAGLFHHFHQSWTCNFCTALNDSRLPADYFALVEQRVTGPIPDVITLELSDGESFASEQPSAPAVITSPPRARLIQRTEAGLYAQKANRITIRHRHGDVVAVIEIVSPGNKASKAEFRAFIQKAAEFIRQGVHFTMIDLLPPGKRDPGGIHSALWEELADDETQSPPDKPLTLASYESGPEYVAYVEYVAVGDALPDMPLFLAPGSHVPAPLEATYQSTWKAIPAKLRKLLQSPNSP